MMSAPRLRFSKLPGQFAICRLPAESSLPAWAFSGGFSSVTTTEAELSIVCDIASLPQEVKSQQPWTGLKLEGPFAFEQAGVLASFVGPLAEEGVPIFAISTYDTDYVFVNPALLDVALDILRKAGHELVPPL